MYDTVIKGGRVIDGTGSPTYFADVAIENGRIVRVARGLEGKRVIDAKGLVVTPGFIDSHSHSDNSILTFPDQTEKIEQGITTSIGGQCGGSVAPKKNEGAVWSVDDFMNEATDVPQGSNIMFMVGHRNLREIVMGIEDREPTACELERMKDILRESLGSGAIGLSFGLIYTPSCSAKTYELIELAKVAGEYNAIVSAHIRNEGPNVIKAVEEFISVVEAAGVRGVISHHKSSVKENWGKVNTTLRMIDEANKRGVEVYCDVYPYTASSTSLSATFIPKELRGEGRDAVLQVLTTPDKRKELKEWNISLRDGRVSLDWVLVTSCPAHPEYQGLRIPEIGKIRGCDDDYETLFDIMTDCGGAGNACYFTMCEEDVETVLIYPRAMICTDSGVAGKSEVYHPRLRGTFTRVLGRYVRERKVTTLPEMIRKMTSMPAAVYGLSGKGIIKEGLDADICIFNPDTIIDRADYVDCKKRAEGLAYVILNGEIVVENAVYNGKRMGRVILAH